MYVCTFTAPAPKIFVRQQEIQQRTAQETYDLVCLIHLSSTVAPNSVNLTWNITNDNRVTVIPTTITTDDSIGILYTTVIQLPYLIEGNYTCTLKIDKNLTESTINLISKHNVKVKYYHTNFKLLIVE